MKTSERLLSLHELNQREEEWRQRDVRDSVALLALGLFFAAGFIWYGIGHTRHVHVQPVHIVKDQR